MHKMASWCCVFFFFFFGRELNRTSFATMLYKGEKRTPEVEPEKDGSTTRTRESLSRQNYLTEVS